MYSSPVRWQTDHAESTRPGIFLRGRRNIPVDIVFPQAVTSSLNILIGFLTDCSMNKGSFTGSFEDLVKHG